MSNTPSRQAENILVVDDTPANLQLLTGMLKERGFRVRPVSSGEMALRAIEAKEPDLILLDVTMPDMDGYEVCRRIKQDERWKDIPVLFISALNETEHKVHAFQTGGVDYVSKPFQLEEVEARVRTHLELRRQRLELKESYAKLLKLEELRDSLTHMIVHDMRSPLMAVRLTLDLLEDSSWTNSQEPSRIIAQAKRSVTSLVDMASQMLDVSRMEAGKLVLHRQRYDLSSTIREAVETLGPLVDKKSLRLDVPPPLFCDYDADLIRRVVTNLLHNAIKFTPTGGIIDLRLRKDGPQAICEVTDQGPGVAIKDRQRIFEKFGQLEGTSRQGGSGLGLTFAKLAIEAHGGQIGVLGSEGKGSTFWFSLLITPAHETR